MCYISVKTFVMIIICLNARLPPLYLTNVEGARMEEPASRYHGVLGWLEGVDVCLGMQELIAR